MCQAACLEWSSWSLHVCVCACLSLSLSFLLHCCSQLVCCSAAVYRLEHDGCIPRRCRPSDRVDLRQRTCCGKQARGGSDLVSALPSDFETTPTPCLDSLACIRRDTGYQPYRLPITPIALQPWTLPLRMLDSRPRRWRPRLQETLQSHLGCLSTWSNDTVPLR